MFVRTENKVKKKVRVSEKEQARDPDFLLEKLKTREKERIDYKRASPLAFLSAATKPVLFAFIGMMAITSVSGRHPNIDVFEGRVIPSSLIAVGSVLAEEDNMMQTKDYTLSFPAEGETTIMIVWDYAVEDGDMVSVLFDGKPMGDSFNIMHAPKTIKVPKGAKVEVIGTFDGGGGITYAVNFPEIQKTILNGLSSGEQNVYTLTKAN